MASDSGRGWTLVWIDTREAIVLRWRDGPEISRQTLEVPPHERSAGHVRLAPGRHGGGRSQSGLETHRLDHLRRDIARVAATLPTNENVLLIGPGYVREHLEAELRAEDAKTGRTRTVRSEPASRLTQRQLIERLRGLVGKPSPRLAQSSPRPR